MASSMVTLLVALAVIGVAASCYYALRGFALMAREFREIARNLLRRDKADERQKGKPLPTEYLPFRFRIDEIQYLEPDVHFTGRTLLFGYVEEGTIAVGQSIVLPRENGTVLKTGVLDLHDMNDSITSSAGLPPTQRIAVLLLHVRKGLVRGIAVNGRSDLGPVWRPT